VHGVTSHGGWYGSSAAYLADAGCEVAFVDRRGSGLNRDALGDVPGWQTWLDDVAAFRIAGGMQFSCDGRERDRIPTFLCGISWGGKLATAVARRYPWLFDGLALICPGIYSPFMPGPGKRLALRLLGSSGMQQRRVAVPLRRSELFTDSPRWREFIARDPLALRTITWRFAREDVSLTRYARAAAPFIHMPLLVMLAGRDRIIDNNRTRRLFGQFASRNKTLIEYPTAGHTLEFELDPKVYFLDLKNWIQRIKLNT
jgi:alpha-beta hydrolase superfamily lysophospholipase